MSRPHVKNILKLYDDRGCFFIATDSTIFAASSPIYTKGCWVNWDGTLRIHPQVADMLSDVMFKKHKPIFVIDIFDAGKYSFPRFVYEENGELISIWDDGRRPLKESLMEQRKAFMQMRNIKNIAPFP